MQNLIKIGSAVWVVALTQTHTRTHAHTHTPSVRSQHIQLKRLNIKKEHQSRTFFNSVKKLSNYYKCKKSNLSGWIRIKYAFTKIAIHTPRLFSNLFIKSDDKKLEKIDDGDFKAYLIPFEIQWWLINMSFVLTWLTCFDSAISSYYRSWYFSRSECNFDRLMISTDRSKLVILLYLMCFL